MKNKIVYILLFLFIGIVAFRLYDLGVTKGDYYKRQYTLMEDYTIEGADAPRGRILDVKGRVLVDNVGVNTLIYNRLENNGIMSEIDIAFALSKIISFDENNFTASKIKNFYILDHGGCNELITQDEWTDYKYRRLSSKDIDTLKRERITDEVIANLDYEYKNASYIYSLLSTGYYYDNKILKKHLSDEDVVRLNDADIPGIKVVLTWERFYPYENVLRSIFGLTSTNGVPLEYKEHYQEKGVKLYSTVGISGLEFEYDEYLRGTPAKLKIENSSLVTIESESRGADLYLSIDIEKQLAIESIMKEEIKLAKTLKSTRYFDRQYVLVGDAQDGSIVAMSGLLLGEEGFSDITIDVINSSYTVGSIVKGASMSVGYQKNLIEMGKPVWDSCIKVYNVPQKCSWTRLGYIDDIKAMAQSSNYYQFLIATRLTNPFYRWNSRLNATNESFTVYRDMFASYGLGVKTGIDLPNEHVGIIGGKVSDDLLLNLSIGQYDTYTPIEVFQYIGTIAASGEKLKPSLLKKIVKDDEIVLAHEREVLGKVDLTSSQMTRVQQGLRAVMTQGLGYNYTNRRVTSAGKTGTSETFVDTDHDGVVDTSTLSTSFVMYAPFDNPRYTVAIISPNIAVSDEVVYPYSINSRINNKITNYLFENS